VERGGRYEKEQRRPAGAGQELSQPETVAAGAMGAATVADRFLWSLGLGGTGSVHLGAHVRHRPGSYSHHQSVACGDGSSSCSPDTVGLVVVLEGGVSLKEG